MTDLTDLTNTLDFGINLQIQKLKRVDIVVAYPGRLLDHINRHAVDLSQLEVLIIDETG